MLKVITVKHQESKVNEIQREESKTGTLKLRSVNNIPARIVT